MYKFFKESIYKCTFVVNVSANMIAFKNYDTSLYLLAFDDVS